MTTLQGSLQVTADKSISHRAVMFGALAAGRTRVHHLLLGSDVKTTMRAFQQLGVNMRPEGDDLTIEGRNFQLAKSDKPLDMGNSGTSTRLMLGILAGQTFDSQLIGDVSLSTRPMGRVALPLSLMGADIKAQGPKGTLPIYMRGAVLRPVNFEMPVASAQVKSALIFAALQANGHSKIVESLATRNHTEQMLPFFGGKLTVEGPEIYLDGPQRLQAAELTVPGDISSAAFWIVGALITPGSDILLKGVGINPTRTGILDVVAVMGGNFELLNVDELAQKADIHVKYTENLQGTEIAGSLIPRLIDEIPIIALLATQAASQTVIKDAAELRVKESNRIDSLAELLAALGADVQSTEDGLIIQGSTRLHGAQVDSKGDHRLAMTAAIADLISIGKVEIAAAEMIATSYPTFFEDLKRLCQ